jgi:hypothetical protein
MSGIENRLFTAVAELFASNVIKPLVSYISENPDFTGKNNDEIESVIREAINVPQTTVVTAAVPKSLFQGVAALAPSLSVGSGLSGLGAIAPVASKAKAVKGAKKEHPPQVWMTADAWQAAVAGGARICAAYSSSRVKDESKKDKACGAAIDESVTETDCFKWRCSQCKPDAVSVEKYIKKAVTGPIDPAAVKSGINVPNLTPKTSSPPSASMLPQPPKPTEVSPVVATLGKLPSPKMQNAAKPMSPAPTINLAVHPGLKTGKHLKALNDDLNNIIFDVIDRSKPTIQAIGKYSKLAEGPVPPHYEQHVEELTPEEIKSVRRYGIEYVYTCVKPDSPVTELPVLPGGIKLPEMNLPKLDDLPQVIGIPGLLGK